MAASERRHPITTFLGDVSSFPASRISTDHYTAGRRDRVQYIPQKGKKATIKSTTNTQKENVIRFLLPSFSCKFQRRLSFSF